MAEDVDSCTTCKHFLWKTVDGTRMPTFNCNAFPKGIPTDIQLGGFIHNRPFKGDNGIRYERRRLEKIERTVIPGGVSPE